MTELVESSGRTKRNTELSIERKPAIAEEERDFFFRRKRRKSAILGIEGLEIEWPFDLHQDLKTAHLAW